MLYPARARKDLLQRLLCFAKYVSIGVEDDCTAAGSSLVEREDVLHLDLPGHGTLPDKTVTVAFRPFYRGLPHPYLSSWSQSLPLTLRGQ